MIQDHHFHQNPTLLNISRHSLLRILIFSAVWFILTGSDTSSWIIGVPAVLLASKLSLMLAPPSQCLISVSGALRFIPFFFINLFVAALMSCDVPSLRSNYSTRDLFPMSHFFLKDPPGYFCQHHQPASRHPECRTAG